MNSDRIEMRQLLRTDAEKMLSSLSPSEATALPTEVLLHELLVHKVELEVQNEELQRAYISMEEARDRYIDLYEFSPAGYITIDRKGLISEINLTGAALLGVERTKLLNRRFAKHVAAVDKDRWHRLFMNLMESTDTDKHEFDLEMTRTGAPAFPARIDCLRVVSKASAPMLRLSLLDISKIRQDETQTRLAAIAFRAPYGMMITKYPADKSGLHRPHRRRRNRRYRQEAAPAQITAAKCRFLCRDVGECPPYRWLGR